jgi:quercetin dioxygenase-like cupin family protein
VSYFADAASVRGSGGRYTSVDELPRVDAGGGVTLRPLSGADVMLSYVTVAPHGVAPEHTHDEEQMGVVVSGHCEFVLDGEVRNLGPGDVYHAPPGVPHGVRTGDEECVIVDVFSPPRQALLDLMP